MKRLGDQSCSGSQSEGAFGADSHTQNPVGGGHKLTPDVALQFLKEVKETFQDQKEKNNQFLEVMKDFKAQRIGTEGAIDQLKELFKGHNNLIYRFNTFMPKNYEITIDDDGPPPKKAVEFAVAMSSDDKKALKRIYHQEFMFCEKVKERLEISDDYQTFLKGLHRYSTEIITRSELQSLVADLLGKYPDLMEAFNEFLDRCDNIDGFLARVMNKKSIWNDGHLPQSVKADEKVKAPARELEPAKEKTTKDYDSKSIQELDLSHCERCTPSYRLLPDDYPKVSQRSGIGVQELNDYCVSVTSGSEDYSFKHMRRNQYEESLIRCEDDRFELDMLLESVTSTTKRAEDLLNSINNNTIGRDGHIRIEDYLTSLNLRCIERLYGDHGLEFLDILRKNPAVALHVILSRLKKKQEEWNKCRTDFNKVWAGIYSKNHNKSLDHRSFYFKQQDSKNLSTKSLLLEMKEMKENNDMLLAISSGNKRPLIPHFEYEYPNADIHDDLYKLIKYYCVEVCSSQEELNKVMNFWTTFLEPMLGMISRSYGEERDGSPDANARQPKLVPNGDKSIHADASKTSEPNGDTINKDGNFCESDATCREDSSSNVRLKTQHDSGSPDRIPEQLLCSTGAPQNDTEKGHSRRNIEAGSGPQCTVSRPLNSVEDFWEPKSNMDPTLSVSGAPDGSATTLVNGAFGHGSMPNQYPEGPSKVEKEERELSPNGDIDKNNSIASEGGDDVSGSEPREDHEEEDVEHDELDGKVESEGEAEVHYSGSYGNALSSSEPLLLSVKPLSKYVTSIHKRQTRKILEFSMEMTISMSFFGFIEYCLKGFLQQKQAQHLLKQSGEFQKTHMLMQGKRYTRMIVTSRTPCMAHIIIFPSFMSTLYHLLDGTSDNAKFEDDCLAIFGNQSYVLFTLDKLIHKLVKQLQAVATDEMDNKLIQLYEYEKSRTPGKFFDSVYHENTCVILHEESIYRFEFSSFPTGMRMSIQLMEKANEKPEMVAPNFEPSFDAYLFNDFLSILSSRKEPQGVLLQRNKRKYAGLDEYSATSKAMEGVQLFNGLGCKIVCNSSKIIYLRHSEDFFSRGNKRKNLPLDVHIRLDQTRVRRFHRFLDAKTS